MSLLTFTDGTAFTLAASVTKGASGGAQVTSSATYDFNTSVTMNLDMQPGRQRPTTILMGNWILRSQTPTIS